VSTAVSLDLTQTQHRPGERDYPAPTSIGCNLLKSESAARPRGGPVNQQQSQRLYQLLVCRGNATPKISRGASGRLREGDLRELALAHLQDVSDARGEAQRLVAHLLAVHADAALLDHAVRVRC